MFSVHWIQPAPRSDSLLSPPRLFPALMPLYRRATDGGGWMHHFIRRWCNYHPGKCFEDFLSEIISGTTVTWGRACCKVPFQLHQSKRSGGSQRQQAGLSNAFASLTSLSKGEREVARLRHCWKAQRRAVSELLKLLCLLAESQTLLPHSACKPNLHSM